MTRADGGEGSAVESRADGADDAPRIETTLSPASAGVPYARYARRHLRTLEELDGRGFADHHDSDATDVPRTDPRRSWTPG